MKSGNRISVYVRLVIIFGASIPVHVVTIERWISPPFRWTNNERNAPRESFDRCFYPGTYIYLMTQPRSYIMKSAAPLLTLPRISFLNRYYNLTVCLVIDRNLPDKRARSVSIAAPRWFIVHPMHDLIDNSMNYWPNNWIPSKERMVITRSYFLRFYGEYFIRYFIRLERLTTSRRGVGWR